MNHSVLKLYTQNKHTYATGITSVCRYTEMAIENNKNILLIKFRRVWGANIRVRKCGAVAKQCLNLADLDDHNTNTTDRLNKQTDNTNNA